MIAIRVPQEFADVIASLQVKVYQEIGRLPSKGETTLIFLECVEVNQKKLSDRLESMRRPKRISRVKFSFGKSAATERQ
jgi:hypothetical protein